MKKVDLNPFEDTVRAGQVIYQYGPGAMVNFPHQVLMTAAPEMWTCGSSPRIHDARLEQQLGVEYFCLPIDSENENAQQSLSYVRFPEWYYCPRCHKLQKMAKWLQDLKDSVFNVDSEVMQKQPFCPHCSKLENKKFKPRWNLTPVRLVTVCDRGHIDDFPWVEWAHYKSSPKREICDNPELTITHTNSPGAVNSVRVKCKCGANASLTSARMPKALENIPNYHCHGRHPWRGPEQEDCQHIPKVVSRADSSVYYPVTISSLVIPTYPSKLKNDVQNNDHYMRLRDGIREAQDNEGISDENIKKRIDKKVIPIAKLIGAPEEKVCEVLEQEFLTSAEEQANIDDATKFREEEYLALSGQADTEDDNGDFVREPYDGAEYAGLDFIKQVTLLHKIREVKVQLGFSRIEPVSGMDDDNFVSIKPEGLPWYPGCEVRGEGIFIELKEAAIEDWIKQHPEVVKRAEKLNENYAKTYYAKAKARNITPKYLLMHSLAHALIEALSFECGYGVASMQERIYVDSGEPDGLRMAGIFIYTASGDSEGTLGGLVSQGYPDILPRIFRAAIAKVSHCSNDPVCSSSQGQGRWGLNLAACHSCLLLPETSCEDFNNFLDRGVLIGTLEKPEIGFFSDLLKEMLAASVTK